MKRLLSIAAVLALAAARPETYKENEDFQYSRSSTDEGAKSGYYGAQRGNMGGNYERAHNMDGLAQHQMNTAVKQVEGELGEASKMNSGNVFTSANSGGMFGSGHYDVSNLQGRNFHESAGSHGAGGSHSSLSSYQSGYNDQLSSSMHNTGYNSISQNAGYRRRQGLKSGQELQSSDLLAAGNVHDTNYGYDAQGVSSSHSTGHSSQSGYQSHSTYDSNSANQYNSNSGYRTNPQSRIVYATPVRIVGRPGTRVAIPVGVQTYDATHSASTLGHEDAEILSNADQHISQKPAYGGAKSYESSYSYRKQWEKHDVQPEVIGVAVPTESPFPQNSELYEDGQTSNNQYNANGFNSQSGHSSSMNSAYSTKSSSSANQQHEAATAGSQHTASSSNLNANSHGAYSSDSAADMANVLGSTGTKPKSYQSSYSYHKSWERQGDPYVIKPVGEAYTGQDLQRLTATSNNHGYSSHQAGSNYRQTRQGYTHGNDLEDCDCDVNGYRRVARSVRNTNDQRQDEGAFGQQVEQNDWHNSELQQQTQSSWNRASDLRQVHDQERGRVQQEGDVQQNQWRDLEDLGQHAHNSWGTSEDLRQTHNHRQVHNHQGEDVGQQVQENQWDKLEELGQHTQNTWGPDTTADLRQTHNHKQAQNLQDEDLGQVQQNQRGKLENFGQHTQNSWDNSSNLRQRHHHQQAQVQQQEENDFGQQVQQNQWDNSEALTQQVQQNKWDISENNAQSQRHSNQDIRDVEQESNDFKPAWTPSLSDFLHENPAVEDQQQMTQDVLSNFNQEQQTPPFGWLDQDQKKIQTQSFRTESQQTSYNRNIENLEQKYLESHDREETQQANKPWGGLEYLDQHKNIDQQQDVTTPKAVWSSINNPGLANNNPPSRPYHNDKVQSETGGFGFYDWSESSADQASFDRSQLDNFWNKISIAVENNDSSTLNKGQHGEYHDKQYNIISNSTTVKPNNVEKPNGNFPSVSRITTKKPQTIRLSQADVGRGDIGPEEDVEQIQNTDSKLFRTPAEISLISKTKDNNNKINHTIDQVNEISEQTGNGKEQTSNKLYGEKSKINVLHVVNSTVDNREKNKTQFNTDFFNQNTGKNSDKQVNHKFKVDTVSLEQIHQDDYNWQQSENDNETVWGPSLKSFMQMEQQHNKPQDKAETFGVRIIEKQNRAQNQNKTQTTSQLAEQFMRNSIKEPDNQRETNLFDNLQNINIPVEPTTQKPGFWMNAKNKFVSWFKSS